MSLAAVSLRLAELFTQDGGGNNGGNGGGNSGGTGGNGGPEESPALQPEDVVEVVDDTLLDQDFWIQNVAIPAAWAFLLIVLGLVFRWLVYRAIDRTAAGMSEPKSKDPEGETSLTARMVMGEDPIAAQRRELRATTVATMAKSVSNAVIMTIVILMALAQFGINLGPLVAGAGIAGVALGFGAQSLVADFLSGIFMLIEDQYGVGDIIDMGEASGTVEDVGLRVTRLRAVDGVVWYVRNGEIIRIGNMSQGWSRALLDVGVGYGEDVSRVRTVLGQVAGELATDADWKDLLLEEPQVLGLEDLAADSVVVRLWVKTQPGEQWGVARELRQRIKARFDAEGIEIPFPQRTLWVRNEQPAGDAA